MNKLLSKIYISLLLIFLLSSVVTTNYTFASSDLPLDNVENKFDNVLNEADKRFKNIEKKWESIKEDLSLLENNKKDLSEEIQRIKSLSNVVYEKIQKTNVEIKELEEDLNKLFVEIKIIENELTIREADFRDRIQSSSMVNFDNYFKVLLSSSKLSDFLSNFSFIQKIVEQDNTIIEDYLELSEQLNNKKIEQDKIFDELKVKAKELTELRKSLLKENENNQSLYEEMDKEQADLLNEYKYYKVLYEEEKKLLEDLREQKKIFDEFSNYITDRTGDYGLNTLVEYKRLQLIEKAKAEGIHLITTSGYRSFVEQNKLFNQGRNGNSGSIVTNAVGGQSWHNYGLAFDVAFDNGNGIPTWEEYDMNKNGIDDWEEIGKLGESIGLEWGGRWEVLVDKPHFQMTFGKDIAELYRIFTGGF